MSFPWFLRKPPLFRFGLVLSQQSVGGLVRFFRRSKEWVYFTAHGLDADLVSREAFKNASAVSFQSGGLPSITIRSDLRLVGGGAPNIATEQIILDVHPSSARQSI